MNVNHVLSVSTGDKMIIDPINQKVNKIQLVQQGVLWTSYILEPLTWFSEENPSDCNYVFGMSRNDETTEEINVSSNHKILNCLAAFTLNT